MFVIQQKTDVYSCVFSHSSTRVFIGNLLKYPSKPKEIKTLSDRQKLKELIASRFSVKNGKKIFRQMDYVIPDRNKDLHKNMEVNPQWQRKKQRIEKIGNSYQDATLI